MCVNIVDNLLNVISLLAIHKEMVGVNDCAISYALEAMAHMMA